MTEILIRHSTAPRRTRVTAACRLAQFRAALLVFVSLSVLMVVHAVPTLWQTANLQNIADHWTPGTAATLTAVGILLAWWGSLVVACVADTRLPSRR